jgi:hypothetical protein
MRRLILGPDVRLDLDDPADAIRLPHEAGAEERPRRFEGGSGELAALEVDRAADAARWRVPVRD